MAAQDLSVHEGFDYGVRRIAPLSGMDGGAGWLGSWIGVDHTAGLASHWPLDSDAGDLGPFAAHGTLVGGAFSPDVPGLPWSTGSLQLEVSNREFVDLAPHAGQFAELMRGTISVWIKVTGSGTRTVFSASDSDQTPPNDLALRVSAAGRLQFTVRGELYSRATLNSTTRVDDGQWHHAAVTLDGGGVCSLYVDGVLEEVRTLGFFANVRGTDQVSIGRNVYFSRSQQHYDGWIDDLAIWGRALPASSIAALASGTVHPSQIPEPDTRNGPILAGATLSPPDDLHLAFGGSGLAASGNRLSDASGNRAVRLLRTPIDMKADANYYLSCLIRRTDGGSGTSGLEIQLTDSRDVAARFGWNQSGQWVAGIDTPDIGITMVDGVTYFAVLKIAAVRSGDDQVFLKVYRSAQVVHFDDTAFAGQGTGTNQWSVVSTPSISGDRVDQLWIAPLGVGTRVELDELRIGTSWQSVTRLAYGAGCFGPAIGQSGRPALGAEAHSVELRGANPVVAAALLLGTAPTRIDLTFLGGPGCELLSSAEFNLPTTTDGQGNASLQVVVPNDPSLYSASLFAQWVAGDLTNPLPLAFSDGLQILAER